MNHLSELPDYGFLIVEGVDAFNFLQGQLTCDMNLLTPEQSLWGSHCNPKGRMISLFRAFFYSKAVWLRMPQTLLPNASAALKKYSIFFKVNLTSILPPLYTTLGFSGDAAQEELKRIVLKIPIHINQTVLWEDLLFLRVPGTPPRFEIFGPNKKIQEFNKQLSAESQPLLAFEWKYQDLEYGIPNLYPETSEHFVPQMFHLHKMGGVSLKKGCYTGQEIIARSHYRGEVKRHLRLFEIEHPLTLSPGDPFYNQEKDEKRPLGTVIDAVTNSTGSTRILAVVHDEHAKLAHDFAS